jgi:hypothetical protein
MLSFGSIYAQYELLLAAARWLQMDVTLMKNYQ